MANVETRRAHGQRMRKLQNAFHLTVKYALRALPADEFQVHFSEGAFPEPILEVLYDAYCEVGGSHGLRLPARVWREHGYVFAARCENGS